MTAKEISFDVHALIHSRRSVRRFTEEPVSRKLIERIIETATHAPNAHNRQPWRFIVLITAASKASLSDAMGADFHQSLLAEGLSPEEAQAQVARSRERITQAPAAILLCLDSATLDHYDDPNRQQGELTMAIQSVAMAGSTLLLAAHSEGLGAVWICAPLFTPNAVQESLNLPTEWLPQGMILLGYPDKIPKPRVRNPVDAITIFK